MKRLLGVSVAVAVAAAALAAWGGAASGKSPEAAAPASPAAAEQKRKRLPPLPREVRQRKRWLIGVKCDTPPFGYINIRGEKAGFDVDIAKWFARFAFGRQNRVTLVCAPTATREPLLTTDRVDLVISTFTYTRDRDTRIDFSRAYYKASGKLAVPNESPIRRLADIRGRRIATTDGSIYHRWMRRCFSNAEVVTTDGVTGSLLRLQQGRADAVMWDDGALAPAAASDPNVKLLPDTFLEGPYGIGIKQGNTAMKRWVDSRLGIMQKKDTFMTILRNHFAGRFVRAYTANILRPKRNIPYPPAGAPDPETVCP